MHLLHSSYCVAYQSGEIMHLVASVRLFALSHLNCLMLGTRLRRTVRGWADGRYKAHHLSDSLSYVVDN